nr:MAG TPA: hypothetical protein [Caudoviricetes sp.]
MHRYFNKLIPIQIQKKTGQQKRKVLYQQTSQH